MISQLAIYRASGKVLVAGGYGVLEEGNIGLSLAVSNHFYSITSVEWGAPTTSAVSIEVESPQISGNWHYSYQHHQNNIQELNHKVNVFVQNAVKYALQYCLNRINKEIKKIKITVLFDRGFLSESAEQRVSKAKLLDYKGETSKTGLGSSACVVVAVAGGILKQILGKYSEDEVNIVSQFANTAAQNKIGSNFDISTAVYGSQLYKNVLPRRIFEAVEKGDIMSVVDIDPEISLLKPSQLLVERACSWMIDLRRGSNTRTMVSGFIKRLHQHKPEVTAEFYLKNKQFVAEIEGTLCSQLALEELVTQLRKVNYQYRQFIQKYSEITQVPVEPLEFNRLLDEISSLEGVAYCLCPGSGGYDAIFVLALPDPSAQPLEPLILEVCRSNGIDCSLSRIDLQWVPSALSPSEVQLLKDYLHPLPA